MRENLLDVFSSPHHGSLRFYKKNNIQSLYQITVDRYLFLDSGFIFLIPAREERRQYLMFKMVPILTVHVLPMRV